jgi:hypothetical protein
MPARRVNSVRNDSRSFRPHKRVFSQNVSHARKQAENGHDVSFRDEQTL